MGIGRFVCGIAALVYSPATGQYLLLRRANHKDYEANEWECVTGRVDQGEGFEEAVYREAREEIGVRVEIEFFIGTTHFYRGPATPENELLGVKYLCSLPSPDSITISPEHSEYRWATAEEAGVLLPPDHWLYQTIRHAEAIRRLTPSELRAYYRDTLFRATSHHP